jgi:hypothetical protein
MTGPQHGTTAAHKKELGENRSLTFGRMISAKPALPYEVIFRRL